MMILKVQRNVYIIYGVEEFSDQIMHMCMVHVVDQVAKNVKNLVLTISHHILQQLICKKKESQHMMFGQCLSNEFVFGETNQDKLPIKR